METLAVRRVRIPVANPPSPAQHPSVLLVTGDADLRAAAARALERHGYEVHTASHSGHAWLKCLTAERLDAVVAELSMDDTSGPALAERLRTRHPGLAALYLARSGTPECDNVLVRPFVREDLLARLDGLVSTLAV